jgi:Cdc6-like AAA superfamily ATPase
VTTHETLSESYISENILHRENALAQLSNPINVVNTFVHGPSGSGKTLTIKKAVEEVNTNRKGCVIYIDCSLYQTTNAIFHEILLSISSIVSSKSNYDLTKKLKAKMRNLDR